MNPATPPLNQPSNGWTLRVATFGCAIGSVVLAGVGLRLLFSGNWLESHEVKYGPLSLLLLAVLAATAALGLGVAGVIRRPREVASWVIAALVVLPIPLAVLATEMLGV